MVTWGKDAAIGTHCDTMSRCCHLVGEPACVTGDHPGTPKRTLLGPEKAKNLLHPIPQILDSGTQLVALLRARLDPCLVAHLRGDLANSFRQLPEDGRRTLQDESHQDVVHELTRLPSYSAGGRRGGQIGLNLDPRRHLVIVLVRAATHRFLDRSLRRHKDFLQARNDGANQCGKAVKLKAGPGNALLPLLRACRTSAGGSRGAPVENLPEPVDPVLLPRIRCFIRLCLDHGSLLFPPLCSHLRERNILHWLGKNVFLETLLERQQHVPIASFQNVIGCPGYAHFRVTASELLCTRNVVGYPGICKWWHSHDGILKLSSIKRLPKHPDSPGPPVPPEKLFEQAVQLANQGTTPSPVRHIRHLVVHKNVFVSGLPRQSCEIPLLLPNIGLLVHHADPPVRLKQHHARRLISLPIALLQSLQQLRAQPHRHLVAHGKDPNGLAVQLVMLHNLHG
mmetsp:Transcript_4465/g.11604  ORF Transcript_4465/g.11604 Transcript_4465/m.11604 type:complete len:452 (+) Transcript_4465:896-2251(+)